MINKDGRFTFAILFALGIYLMCTAFVTINNDILKTSLKDISVVPWNIKLTNLKKLSNEEYFDLTIDETRTNIYFDLDKPGKKYQFELDVINNSSYNTIVNDVEAENRIIGTSDLTGNTYYLSDYIDISSTFPKGYIINSFSSSTVKVTIYIKNNLSADEIYVLDNEKNTKKEFVSINIDLKQA